ncbi:Uncharacterised protein [uncultured archaeon]|nr:Uncharacterised protein [uncultured archaeon]
MWNYKTYYWQVVARDSLNATSSGPTWNFTTAGVYYVPGDANGDRQTNGNDVVYLVNYFKGGRAPPVYINTSRGRFYPGADANGDRINNGNDVVFLVNYFKGIQPRLRYCPAYAPANMSLVTKLDIGNPK